MTIVLTGGGSGGHITPLLAIADQLKKARPEVRIVYIGQRGDKLADIPAKHPSIDKTYFIRAGKFRRYHGEGWRQFFNPITFFKNARDLLWLIVGWWQSRRLLKKIKPSVIFTPGGFVGVPVGFAASQLAIPFVTHDLDAVPGLANRINARWAVIHAVGQPKELYDYPADKTVEVGIPIREEFKPVTEELQATYRRQLDLSKDKLMLFVIGGGLGAQRLNEAIFRLTPQLLSRYPKLVIIEGVGRDNEAELKHDYQQLLEPNDLSRVMIKGYFEELAIYSGAADVIVTRAGATNLAEFAAQAKPCIIVPNPLLTGGHQLKNAQALADRQAAVVVNEASLEPDPQALLEAITSLLDDKQQRQRLGDNLGRLANRHSAEQLAQLLLKQAAEHV